jgi:hypothetical protein
MQWNTIVERKRPSNSSSASVNSNSVKKKQPSGKKDRKSSKEDKDDAPPASVSSAPAEQAKSLDIEQDVSVHPEDPMDVDEPESSDHPPLLASSSMSPIVLNVQLTAPKPRGRPKGSKNQGPKGKGAPDDQQRKKSSKSGNDDGGEDDSSGKDDHGSKPTFTSDEDSVGNKSESKSFNNGISVAPAAFSHRWSVGEKAKAVQGKSFQR